LLKIPYQKNGFTLLEILITLVILSTGVLAIAHSFTVGMFVSTDVENVDLALNIAQAKMENLENTAYASLADSGPTTDSNFSNFDVTVDVSGSEPIQVDVKVEWDTKGGTPSLTLTTLRADY
jgi:prepilin-type N-terminal cleavage/methylation domain-containing protein